MRWRKAAIKCVADEWRYTSINAGEGSAVRNMLRSLLVSVDDGDIETFRREFTQDIQDDRHFEDTVDDFLDELYEIIDDRDDEIYLDVL